MINRSLVDSVVGFVIIKDLSTALKQKGAEWAQIKYSVTADGVTEINISLENENGVKSQKGKHGNKKFISPNHERFVLE